MKKKRSKLIENATPWLFLFPFIFIYLAFSFYPLIYSFYLSLNEWNGIDAIKFIGFRNYIEALTRDPYLWSSVKNTLIIGLGYAPLQILTALVLSVAISSAVARFTNFYKTAIFLPYITATVAIGIMCGNIFAWRGGILNHFLLSANIIDDNVYWLGAPLTSRLIIMLVMFWQDMGYICVLFLAGLSTIPADYYEAAQIDGANAVQTFFRITIPQLKPVFIFVIVNNVSWLFQVFDIPFIIFGRSRPLGGPDGSVLTPLWYIYDTVFGGKLRYGYASSISYILFFMIFISVVLVYRVMRKGSDEA